MGLHQLIHFIVAEVFPLMDECLAHQIQRSIVQVLGLEGRFINERIARVMLVNHMLFD